MCNTEAHSLLPAAYVFIGLTLGFIFLGCKSGKSYFLRSSGIPVLLAKVSQSSLFSSFQEDTPQILSQSDRLPKLKLHFNDLKLESLALLIDGMSSCKILSTVYSFFALPWKSLIDFYFGPNSATFICTKLSIKLESLAYSLSHCSVILQNTVHSFFLFVLLPWKVWLNFTSILV